tara:strand:+ start:600 stop:1187 length:588 start_codon:yes stop_codon:yes gene_type:complete
MALPNLSGSNIQDTYQRVIHTDASGLVYNGTGSILPIAFSGQDVRIDQKLILGGFTNVSASLASAVASGDGLGNHQANQALALNGNQIDSVSNISASGHISSSTMSAFTGSFDHIITQNQTIEFRDTSNVKVGDIKFHPTDGMAVNKGDGSLNKLELSKLVVRENDALDGKVTIQQGNIDATGEIFFNKLTGGTF